MLSRYGSILSAIFFFSFLPFFETEGQLSQCQRNCIEQGKRAQHRGEAGPLKRELSATFHLLKMLLFLLEISSK